MKHQDQVKRSPGERVVKAELPTDQKALLWSRIGRVLLLSATQMRPHVHGFAHQVWLTLHSKARQQQEVLGATAQLSSRYPVNSYASSTFPLHHIHHSLAPACSPTRSKVSRTISQMDNGTAEPLLPRGSSLKWQECVQKRMPH